MLQQDTRGRSFGIQAFGVEELPVEEVWKGVENYSRRVMYLGTYLPLLALTVTVFFGAVNRK